jgi:hypothetical protein
MYTWAIKQIQSNIIWSGGYTDEQKAEAYLQPGGEWVPLTPPIEAMPPVALDARMMPVERWVYQAGVVTVEPRP